MKEILNSDRICIKVDDYVNEFIVEIYDKFGHYVDETTLSKEDMQVFVKEMEKVSKLFE